MSKPFVVSETVRGELVEPRAVLVEAAHASLAVLITALAIMGNVFFRLYPALFR